MSKGFDFSTGKITLLGHFPFTIQPNPFTYLLWSTTGCMAHRLPSGSSFSEVIGPRGWFMSTAAVGGRPNIRPPADRGPETALGYSFRPHSMPSSRVGQGEAELKPGTGSSERSLKPSVANGWGCGCGCGFGWCECECWWRSAYAATSPPNPALEIVAAVLKALC